MYRAEWVRGARHTAVLGLALAAAGCSVGQGSPDGWRYLHTGPVAVALPKTWRERAGGAVLPGAGGRADAALTVTGAAPARHAKLPADARRETLTLDGRRAQVLSFSQAAPDGRPAGHVEISVRDRAGHPVTIRAWAVDGAAHDPALLQEIVNSVEFPAS
jgi:hypothetical protein